MKQNKKVSKYDIARLEQYKTELYESRSRFTTLFEAYCISETHEPKKSNYPLWFKWKVRHEDLLRRYKKALKDYMLAIVHFNTQNELIKEDMLNNEL